MSQMMYAMQCVKIKMNTPVHTERRVKKNKTKNNKLINKRRGSSLKYLQRASYYTEPKTTKEK